MIHLCEFLDETMCIDSRHLLGSKFFDLPAKRAAT